MGERFKLMFKVRAMSAGFVTLALAVFKPFGLAAWQWEAYAHLLNIWLLGVGVCFITEGIMKFIVRMPMASEQGIDYIIRRNLWFQCINTVLVALMICVYRHFLLSNRVESNQLSWENFFETLVIIGFCSFAIGLYWRYKFRSRYLSAELEEMRQLNGQLQKLQEETMLHSSSSDRVLRDGGLSTPISMPSSTITLMGTTNDKILLKVSDLLYIESVGNYVKVYQVNEGKVRTDLLRATSKQMEDDLRLYPMVVRCHRAFLVNLGQVEQIISRSGNVQLLIKHCHEYIPVSRSNMSAIKQAVKGGMDS